MFQDAIYYAILAFESIVGVVGIRLYEEPPYQIVETIPSRVEVRLYGQRVAAEVTVPRGTDDRASGVAFQALFDYIAGANQRPDGTGEKIAMTVPVEIRGRDKIAMTAPVHSSIDSGMLHMQFFLPQRYTMETAPVPTDDRVRIVAVPAQSIAVLRFSGQVDDVAQAERGAQLIEALTGSSWRPVSAPILLLYDAPFTIPFARRNEVAVVVESR